MSRAKGSSSENKLWDGTTFGSPWMHHTLIKWLRSIDIRIIYWFTYIFVIAPSMVFKHREAAHMYRFFRRGLKWGRLKSSRSLFSNYCSFGRIIIDRFATYAGKKYEIEIEGYDHFDRLAKCPGGFVQLSAHIGNYELAGYSLKAKDKRFNALVYGGEKETVMDNRSKLFSINNIRMIPLRPDMSHIYVVNQALADGEIMSVPADRVFGSPKYFSIPFMGREAKFPQGPFQVAAMRDVPVIFVACMKVSSKKYKVFVIPVASPGELKAKNIRQRAEEIARIFVPKLESLVCRYPYQWFNYYDFWS